MFRPFNLQLTLKVHEIAGWSTDWGGLQYFNLGNPASFLRGSGYRIPRTEVQLMNGCNISFFGKNINNWLRFFAILDNIQRTQWWRHVEFS